LAPHLRGLAMMQGRAMLLRMTLRALLSASGALCMFALAACAPDNAAERPLGSPTAPSPGVILDVSTGADLAGPADLAMRLAAADVVILGERHDNPAHHAGQTDLTMRIASHIDPAALVFEMIPPDAEPEMAELRGRGASGDTFGPLIGWDELGWPDWQYYAPIVDAAPTAPVLGAAVPKAAVRAAMERGAAVVFAEDLGGDAAALTSRYRAIRRRRWRRSRSPPIATRCRRRWLRQWSKRSACATPLSPPRSCAGGIWALGR
jgi:hypothetical protein